MKFDPEAFTITIRKESVDGDVLFVGRVAELPDVAAYEESYEEAHTILLDAITSLKKVADEQKRNFPIPFEPENEYSGRVTLRVTKSLHRSASQMADREGVSLNQFLNTVIAETVGERRGKISSITISSAPTVELNSIYLPIYSLLEKPQALASTADTKNMLLDITLSPLLN